MTTYILGDRIPADEISDALLDELEESGMLVDRRGRVYCRATCDWCYGSGLFEDTDEDCSGCTGTGVVKDLGPGRRKESLDE